MKTKIFKSIKRIAREDGEKASEHKILQLQAQIASLHTSIQHILDNADLKELEKKFIY